MIDRVESIIALIREHAKRHAVTQACDATTLLVQAAASGTCKELVEMIERGDDLKPAKPKPTIADLLTLHDLDLGALAHNVGVTGEDITTEHVEMLCDGFTADMGALTVLVRGAIMANDSPLASESARNVAALGAKVRAALATPTIKVTTPRVLQSANEAPCGSVCQVLSDKSRLVMRVSADHGWGMGDSVSDTFAIGGEGWVWAQWASKDFPANLIAEGLTEAECRHLSGLSAADAIAWCKVREAGRRG